MRTKPLFHFGRNRSLVVQELEPRRVLTGMTCLPPDHTSCSAVVVDDFNDPGTITPLVVNSGTPLDIASDSGLSGVIGGTRTAQLEYLSGILSVH